MISSADIFRDYNLTFLVFNFDAYFCNFLPGFSSIPVEFIVEPSEQWIQVCTKQNTCWGLLWYVELISMTTADAFPV